MHFLNFGLSDDDWEKLEQIQKLYKFSCRSQAVRFLIQSFGTINPYDLKMLASDLKDIRSDLLKVVRS